MTPPDLAESARDLGLQDDALRFIGRRGTTEAALQTLQQIESRFGHHIAAHWWYADGDNSMPHHAIDYRNGDALEAIRTVVPDKYATVWLATRHISEHIVPDHRNPGHDVNLYQGRLIDVCAIIDNSYGFDFFLISQTYEWLIQKHDHGILIAVGSPVAERLQELGPPAAPDAG